MTLGMLLAKGSLGVKEDPAFMLTQKETQSVCVGPKGLTSPNPREKSTSPHLLIHLVSAC